jgi:hypothetical protein
MENKVVQSKDKWEFHFYKFIHNQSGGANYELSSLQDQGWELAGQVVVCSSADYSIIPLKRKM